MIPPQFTRTVDVLGITRNMLGEMDFSSVGGLESLVSKNNLSYLFVGEWLDVVLRNWEEETLQLRNFALTVPATTYLNVAEVSAAMTAAFGPFAGWRDEAYIKGSINRVLFSQLTKEDFGHTSALVIREVSNLEVKLGRHYPNPRQLVDGFINDLRENFSQTETDYIIVFLFFDSLRREINALDKDRALTSG